MTSNTWAHQFDVSKETLKDIAQSMQQAKANARALENICDSIQILASDPPTRDSLAKAATLAAEVAIICNDIYKSIAREAMRP